MDSVKIKYIVSNVNFPVCFV